MISVGKCTKQKLKFLLYGEFCAIYAMLFPGRTFAQLCTRQLNGKAQLISHTQTYNNDDQQRRRQQQVAPHTAPVLLVHKNGGANYTRTL